MLEEWDAVHKYHTCKSRMCFGISVTQLGLNLWMHTLYSLARTWSTRKHTSRSPGRWFMSPRGAFRLEIERLRKYPQAAALSEPPKDPTCSLWDLQTVVLCPVWHRRTVNHFTGAEIREEIYTRPIPTVLFADLFMCRLVFSQWRTSGSRTSPRLWTSWSRSCPKPSARGGTRRKTTTTSRCCSPWTTPWCASTARSTCRTMSSRSWT